MAGSAAQPAERLDSKQYKHFGNFQVGASRSRSYRMPQYGARTINVQIEVFDLKMKYFGAKEEKCTKTRLVVLIPAPWGTARRPRPP